MVERRRLDGIVVLWLAGDATEMIGCFARCIGPVPDVLTDDGSTSSGCIPPQAANETRRAGIRAIVIDQDLEQFRELWTAPAGTYEVVAFDDGEALLPCQIDPPAGIVIEDSMLNALVCQRMIEAGAPVRRLRAACAVGGCLEDVIGEGLCATHVQPFRAAQATRERDGLAPLDPRSWADAEHRMRKRRGTGAGGHAPTT